MRGGPLFVGPRGFARPARARGRRTVRRLSAGLYLADSFERPDGALGAAWEEVTAGWDVFGGRARGRAPAVAARAAVAGVEARARHIVEGRLTRTNRSAFPGLFGRWTARTGAQETGWVAEITQFAANESRIQLLRVLDGAHSGIASYLFAEVLGQAYRVRLDVEEGRQRVWLDGALIITANDVGLNGRAGVPGIRDGYTAEFADPVAYVDDFRAWSGTTVRMESLQDGESLRVGGITAAAAGGIATVDLGDGAVYPIAGVEVLGAGGAVLATYEPEGGVWGGDVFAYS